MKLPRYELSARTSFPSVIACWAFSISSLEAPSSLLVAWLNEDMLSSIRLRPLTSCDSSFCNAAPIRVFSSGNIFLVSSRARRYANIRRGHEPYIWTENLLIQEKFGVFIRAVDLKLLYALLLLFLLFAITSFLLDQTLDWRGSNYKFWWCRHVLNCKQILWEGGNVLHGSRRFASI